VRIPVIEAVRRHSYHLAFTRRLDRNVIAHPRTPSGYV
jgi:hypothetical protein